MRVHIHANELEWSFRVWLLLQHIQLQGFCHADELQYVHEFECRTKYPHFPHCLHSRICLLWASASALLQSFCIQYFFAIARAAANHILLQANTETTAAAATAAPVAAAAAAAAAAASLSLPWFSRIGWKGKSLWKLVKRWRLASRKVLQDAHSSNPWNIFPLLHPMCYVCWSGKLKGVCDMSGLPGTIFWELSVPRKPVPDVSGLTLEKSPAGGTGKKEVLVALLAKWFPWQGDSPVLWISLNF